MSRSPLVVILGKVFKENEFNLNDFINKIKEIINENNEKFEFKEINNYYLMISNNIDNFKIKNIVSNSYLKDENIYSCLSKEENIQILYQIEKYFDIFIKDNILDLNNFKNYIDCYILSPLVYNLLLLYFSIETQKKNINIEIINFPKININIYLFESLNFFFKNLKIINFDEENKEDIEKNKDFEIFNVKFQFEKKIYEKKNIINKNIEEIKEIKEIKIIPYKVPIFLSNEKLIKKINLNDYKSIELNPKEFPTFNFLNSYFNTLNHKIFNISDFYSFNSIFTLIKEKKNNNYIIGNENIKNFYLNLFPNGFISKILSLNCHFLNNNLYSVILNGVVIFNNIEIIKFYQTLIIQEQYKIYLIINENLYLK